MIAINPARVLVSVLFAGLASAQFSMYIPGLDPQSVSVTELGVDAQGHTTWAVAPAVSDPSDGLLSPLTLVEGPNDASFTYALGPIAAGGSCTFSDQLALCTMVVDGTTDVVTETRSSFAVQGGPTGAAGSSPSGSAPQVSPTPSGSAKPTSNPGSGSSSPSSTSGSASAPASSSGSAGSTGAGVKDAVVTAFLGTVVAAASIALAL
ncbi:hypothetical protein EVG20_g5748 [Dentipellis fragilis]|uniref:Ubiquitin 3 binding protein But2 C-terminal domain-containing protein n=1 Tax=Dentipellis fragilis TaxID=205917 RepID=A0A4Y9YTB0_9AGAM|nr:hypothetical protein EVG20_g5748 [Dentipellis fragilis]